MVRQNIGGEFGYFSKQTKCIPQIEGISSIQFYMDYIVCLVWKVVNMS